MGKRKSSLCSITGAAGTGFPKDQQGRDLSVWCTVYTSVNGKSK